MDFSYIDKNEPITIPKAKKNGGLYGGIDMNHIRYTPESSIYSSFFYAKHHIPTNIRIGNNEPDLNIFKYYNKELYNFKCFKDDFKS